MTRQPHSTVRLEAEIGRRHTPDFSWPTIVLFGGLFTIFIASTWLSLAGVIPWAAAAVINTAFIYALYTVVHEAVHSNISSRSKSLRWVDFLIGMTACIPLWLFYYHHKRQHMAHHAHTNDEDDPDIYARGSFAGWIFIRLPKVLVNYFNPLRLLHECRAFNLPEREIRITLLTFAAYALVVAALLAAGFWKEVLVLWFIPWWIGQTLMLTLFTWTPHHDHHETGRYRNTRISLFPRGNLLLLGQNYHLIHHMIPSIPYYRYKRTFEEMRPVLEQHAVRIEGLWPDPAEAPILPKKLTVK